MYSKVLDDVVCLSCKKEHDGIRTGNRNILDANGNIRDRDWLRDKLEMTSSEKKWESDIKSRKVMPDGTVARVKS